MASKGKKFQNQSHRREDIRRATRENETNKTIVRQYYGARSVLYKDVDRVYKTLETEGEKDTIVATSKAIENIHEVITRLYMDVTDEIVTGSDEGNRAGKIYPYLLAMLVYGKDFGFKPDIKSKVNAGEIIRIMAPHRKELIGDLTGIVADAISQKWTIGQVKKAIAEKLVKVDKDGTVHGDASNSLRTWRTEYEGYYNDGRKEGQTELNYKGVKMNRVWNAVLDNATRDDHADAHGQLADDDGMFIVGGHKVDRPGNFGIAEQDINCRCTINEFFPINAEYDKYSDIDVNKFDWRSKSDVAGDVMRVLDEERAKR